MWDGAVDQIVAGYALDALAFGIIIADRDARVAYANAAANHIFGERGTILRCVTGKLCARRSRTQTDILAAVSRVCGNAGRVDRSVVHILAPALDENGTDLAICVIPVDATEPRWGTMIAMLLVRPIERDCNLESEARELFGLTKTEAKFASSLASGLSLLEAAKTHDVTPSTARSHMKNIFRKTGVSRQSQVAALLRGAQIPVQTR